MFSRMPVPEHAAAGVVEEVYHDIRRTLRVTGVNLNFRTWASFERFMVDQQRAVATALVTFPGGT